MTVTHGTKEWEKYAGYQRASDSYIVKGSAQSTAIPVAPFRNGRVTLCQHWVWN